MPSLKHTAALVFTLALALFPISVPAQSPDAGNARITDIKVEGLVTVSKVVVVSRMGSRIGQPLSLRRVREDIHTLFESGDFDDVAIQAEPVAKHPDQVTLVVEVKERPRVHAILFEGNTKKKNKKLLEKMKTTPKTALDPAQLSKDIEEVRKLYHEDGYSQVQVDSKTVPSGGSGHIDLVLTVHEGQLVKIHSIILEGVHAFPEKKIRGKMKDTKEGKKFRPERLDDDLKLIEDFYHNEGYLRASVLSHSTAEAAGGAEVDLTLKIREGVPYSLSGITFEGNSVVSGAEMQKASGLEKGKTLSQKDLDDATQKMRTLYLDKGYIYCQLDPQLDYDDELKSAAIKVKVVEGQIAYIQEIKIAGNYKTRDYVIRRELIMKAGEKFEASKIRAATMALYNLGFFEEVNPEVEPGDKPGQAILVFRVKERKTGSIGLGGGYSSVDKFVGNIKFEEANLFGRGQKFSIEWEIGLRGVTSYNVGFTEPWLFGTKTSLSTSVYNTTQILDYYTERRRGGSVGFGRRLTRKWSVFTTYMFEKVTISDVSAAYSDPTLPTYIPTSVNSTSSVTPRIVYDSRDNYFDPRTGMRHSTSVEFAGGPFGANNNFVKLTQDSSGFLPLFWKFVIGEHVKLGLANGYNYRDKYTDVPIYDKFYCGGTDTVRGYPERSIGPNGGASGGNVLYVWNNELKYPIAGPLRGVLFFDVGGLWSGLKYIQNDLQYGYGAGIRLTIPGTVMAIRLDYGFPLNSDISSASKNGKLHFNLGDIF